MAQRRFRSFQTYNLVIPTTADQIGFELNVVPIRIGANSIMNTDIEAYQAKQYKYHSRDQNLYGYFFQCFSPV